MEKQIAMFPRYVNHYFEYFAFACKIFSLISAFWGHKQSLLFEKKMCTIKMTELTPISNRFDCVVKNMRFQTCFFLEKWFNMTYRQFDVGLPAVILKEAFSFNWIVLYLLQGIVRTGDIDNKQKMRKMCFMFSLHFKASWAIISFDYEHLFPQGK